MLKNNGIALIILIATGLLAWNVFYPTPSDLTIDDHYSPDPKFIENKLKKKLEHPKRYDKPKQAQEFFRAQRMPPGAKHFPAHKYGEALSKIEKMPHYSINRAQLVVTKTKNLSIANLNSSQNTNQIISEWANKGPGNIGGRTRTLLIDPSSPNTMYAAGVSGGVWKTLDAGQNWQPLTDMAANLAISTMTFAHNNSQILFAGTGEGYFNFDALRGDGIFVSSNAGSSWTQLSSTRSNVNFRYVNKIIASPTQSDTLYVASRTGLLKSGNNGFSWSQKFDATNQFSAGCLDLKLINKTNSDTLLMSCGSFEQAAIYRSIDSGETWTQVLAENNMGRTTIDVAPSNNSIVYALSAKNDDSDSSLLAVYKSTDEGQTWSAVLNDSSTDSVSKLLLTNPFFSLCGPNQEFAQGWYDNIIKVDPIDPNIVWAGGIDLFRSNDGGVTFDPASLWWTNSNPQPPEYNHADHHEIVFHPNYNGTSNQTMFVGNDGGVFRTNNARASVFTDDNALCPGGFSPDTSRVGWTSLNNFYGVTQFYHGTVFPNQQTFFGGTQDNGTNIGTEQAGINGWNEILGGDGGWTAVDPSNTQVLFAETTQLSLEKSTNGGQSFSAATSGITEDSNNFLFITPFAMAPNDPQTLWIGGQQLWRTKNQASSWQAASNVIQSGASISAIAIAPTNTNIVAVGTNNGAIAVSNIADSTTATSSWPSSTPVNGGNVSSIAIDPVNPQTMYATYSNFGVAQVWKSINGGTSWQTSNQDLPDIPATSLVIDPDDSTRLFLGTDLGVFVSTNGGQNWFADGSGLANTRITNLQIIGNQLWAFTHGRGLYSVSMIQLGELKVTVNEDQTLNFTQAQFTSTLGDTFDQIRIDSLTSQGTLNLNGTAVNQQQIVAVSALSSLSYTPNADYFGTDSFLWTAFNQGQALTQQATTQITINPVNDLPQLVLNPSSVQLHNSQNENGQIQGSDISLDVTQPGNESNQTVNFSFDPSSSDLVEFTVNQTTLTVTAKSEQFGELNLQITADDGQSDNNSSTSALAIKVNDAPIVIATPTAVSQDAGSSFRLDIASFFRDRDSQLSYSVSESLPGISFEGSVLSGTFNASFHNNITLVATDDLSQTASTTMRVDIFSAPQLNRSIGTQTVNINNAFNLNLASFFSDGDGDPISYSVSGLPAGFSLSGSSITGQSGSTSTNSIQVTASDGRLSTQTSFTLTIQDPNATNSQGGGGGSLIYLILIMSVLAGINLRYFQSKT